MCDYSLQSIRSRPADTGDRLVTHHFGTGTVGFAAADDLTCVVCLQPGTELSFTADVRDRGWSSFLFWRRRVSTRRTAVFRQVNTNNPAMHHDALEFPDGRHTLLTLLYPDQHATVLQLPAAAKVTAPEPAPLEAALL